MASAGPYASLHLAPDRYHTSTSPLSFFTGRMPILPPNQQRQSIEGKKQYIYSAEINQKSNQKRITHQSPYGAKTLVQTMFMNVLPLRPSSQRWERLDPTSPQPSCMKTRSTLQVQETQVCRRTSTSDRHNPCPPCTDQSRQSSQSRRHPAADCPVSSHYKRTRTQRSFTVNSSTNEMHKRERYLEQQQTTTTTPV